MTVATSPVLPNWNVLTTGNHGDYSSLRPLPYVFFDPEMEKMMTATVADLVAWVIVGMLAGSLAGMVVTRKKEGFGRFANVGIGLAGALIGGFLFDILRIDLGLANITVSLQCVVGALIFLGALAYARHWYNKKKDTAKTTSLNE